MQPDAPAGKLHDMNSSSYTKIGPYQIEGQLGRGGMGVVLKGIDSALDRHVAIKLMSETLAHETDVVQRFMREARAMAKISDTHVVQVYAVDTFENRPFIAMEYIQGSDLQQVLTQQGRQTPANAVAYTLAAARGLAAAHEVGLIHRDIKPANLLINQKGVVKVTDFGIALAHMEAATRLTGTGSVVGTPGYLAPEVCMGKPADARSDLYALGVVLFELICGTRPFHGATPLSIMMQVVEHDAPDIRALDASVDDELAGIIASLLAKAPEARMQTCHELVARLNQWLAARSRGVLPPGAGALMQVAAYGSARAVAADTPSGAAAAGGRTNSSSARLSLLSQSRMPLWLGAGCGIAFAITACVQYWVMQLLYESLGQLSGGYDFNQYMPALKFRILVAAGVSILCYVVFALWFLRTHQYLTQARGMAWPKNAKIALLLCSLPPLSLYFSWRIWAQMANVANGATASASASVSVSVQPGATTAANEASSPSAAAMPVDAPAYSTNATALGLWWLSFFGSLGLSATAFYLLPKPLAAAPENTYVLTLELFARGLWLFAGFMALWLMLSISLRAAKIGG